MNGFAPGILLAISSSAALSAPVYLECFSDNGRVHTAYLVDREQHTIQPNWAPTQTLTEVDNQVGFEILKSDDNDTYMDFKVDVYTLRFLFISIGPKKFETSGRCVKRERQF